MQVFDFDKRFCIANEFYAEMVFLFFSWGCFEMNVNGKERL